MKKTMSAREEMAFSSDGTKITAALFLKRARLSKRVPALKFTLQVLFYRACLWHDVTCVRHKQTPNGCFAQRLCQRMQSCQRNTFNVCFVFKRV